MTITPFTGGDAVTMSSQEIADLVSARHDSVKRTIERLAEKRVIQLPPLVEVKNHLGQTVEQYLFSGEKGKRDSLVVVAQLSPEFTGALVDRWQKLEEQVKAPALPGDYISALEHLLESKRSEKLAIEQRDYAIETKAEIGSRREATAMATASAAVREARQLRELLGMGVTQATIVAVEKALGREFGRSGWRPLKKWCQARGINAPHVIHPTFGSVIAWPAAAWMDVYQIDLADLFGADGEQA
ncbi:ORF6N domain-containing protein [Pseudomonas brenneri]|uniref:ORF6N domain-containing protein n=1 Tax=Pseudomonas brenneri TaxID=129817 RepID=UPI0035710605